MNNHKSLLLFCLIFFTGLTAHAQIQVDRISFKGFNATGFGGFFGFGVPISDADYITGDLGLSAFSANNSYVMTAPILAGYRYTINRSGTGFYLEPNAGYGFGDTDVSAYDNLGTGRKANINGPATGLTFGYLFEPSGRIQFNLGLRYEHVFGKDYSPNTFSFRIAHAFIFGRRDSN
jgi:hypothetical protein